MSVGIAEVALSAIDLEPDAVNTAAGPILLGDTFTDASVRDYFDRQAHTTRLRQWRLRDVVLDTYLAMLFHGGQRVRETTVLVPEADAPEPSDRVDRVLSVEPGSLPIVGYNRIWTNYYHWVAQALPAIDNAIQHCTDHHPVCLLPPMGPLQQQTLALLGHRRARYLSVTEFVRARLALCEFSDLLLSAFTVSMSARRTWDRLAAAARSDIATAPHIYVARTDSTNRRMVNEDELIAYLETVGFRIVLPGSYTPEEQIVLFREARVVVGGHGAGMTNIAFCRPGTLIYELLPAYYPNACFNRMAQSGGVTYAADMFQGEGTIETQLQSRWWVDLDVFKRRLETLLRHATAPAR